MANHVSTTRTFRLFCDVCGREYKEVCQEEDLPKWPSGWREVSVGGLKLTERGYHLDVCEVCIRTGTIEDLVAAGKAGKESNK